MVKSHTTEWCDPHSPLSTGFLFNIRQRALVLRLIPYAAVHTFLYFNKAKYLRNYKVCFLFSVQLVHSWLLWLLCCAWLTDGRDEVQEALLWENRVLQSSEVQLQHPRHWVDIKLILVINQGILSWLREKRMWAFSGDIWWVYLVSICEVKSGNKTSSVLDSPLSNEFLMSLTSTCDPGTRKMPCCCKPGTNTTQDLEIQTSASYHYHQNPSASFMKDHCKHITQSRKCNLVIKGDAYFSMRGPLSEAATYGFS